ncbi:MAG: DsbA family protein [Solirubrobacterales bacterium]|nr:DsbA family protein [Solirubrobacterales bacterium]
MTAPVLYFDLASPYAYLAVQRAPAVLGPAVELVPILLGAIFKYRGYGSWAEGAERPAGVAEIERRARERGLPPIVWPQGWPVNSLAAMRAATWAKRHARAGEFVRVAYEREFGGGANLAEVTVLQECATEAGLDAEAMSRAILTHEIKDELRRATDQAWALGVRGVPSVRLGETIFYGDDTIELAAAALAA